MATRATHPIAPESCIPALAGYGFAEPTYTQVPNEIIAALPWLSDPELRILLVLVRYTLGYHRTTCTASYADLERAAHLCRHSVIDTTKRLKAAGLITQTRRYPQSQWRLNISTDTHIAITPTRPVIHNSGDKLPL